MTLSVRTPWKLAGLFLVLGLVIFLIVRAVHRPSFDPDKIAASETRMWKAYYDSDPMTVGRELLGLLRSQFHLSFMDAVEVSRDLGSAAAKFHISSGNYEAIVLPDLVKAYTRLQEISGEPFDPEEAARAELSWWVARRTAGINSPKEVGKRIANLYAILYGEDKPEFQKAGRLRAQAADLRDKNGDWKEIEKLLQLSYTTLVDAL